jgi:hypothetical protein
MHIMFTTIIYNKIWLPHVSIPTGSSSGSTHIKQLKMVSQARWRSSKQYKKYHLQHIHVYILPTDDTPETRTGVITQQTEDKQYIELVIIHAIRDARWTQHEIL